MDLDLHDTVKYLCGKLLRDFTDDGRTQCNIKGNEATCPPSNPCYRPVETVGISPYATKL